MHRKTQETQGNLMLVADRDQIAEVDLHIAPRNHRFFVAVDGDNDRIFTDVQILDELILPRMAGGHFEFVQLNADVVLELERAEDDFVIHLEFDVALWDDNVGVADDRHDDQLGRQGDFKNMASDPGVVVFEGQHDEFDVVAVRNLGECAHVGVLFHKARGNNTGRDRDKPDAEEGDHDRHELAGGRDRIDVAVADGQQCRNSPPDPRKGVFEHIRLCLVFEGVHADRRGEHHDQDNADRGKQLLAFVA